MKKRIAIDMDDTVADTLSRHLEWYKKEFGVQLQKEDTRGTKIYNIVPEEHLPTVRNFPNQSAFFEELPVFDDAQEVIESLSQKYDVYFATAAMEYPCSFEPKYRWLKKYFPFIDDMNYIFCGFKGILNCDYLIDDSSRHIDVFRGEGLLYTAQHNINETGYNRVSSWKEVAEKLL